MSKTLPDGRVILTLKEALARLPDKPEIHTFRSTGRLLIGCDWSRDAIVEALAASDEIQETGDHAQGLGHGLAVVDEIGPLFIEAAGPEELIGDRSATS